MQSEAIPTKKRRAPARAPEEVPRPFIKAVGGKGRLLPELAKRAPEKFGRYWEPFVGGGALFWHFAREGKLGGGAVLADENGRLIRSYIGVRDDVAKVIDKLHEHADLHRVLGYEHFLKMRAALRDEAFPPAVMAAWFIYVNRAGYNGIWRVNKKGACNVPFGDGSPIFVDEENLRACARALQRGVEILASDFDAVLTLGCSDAPEGPEPGDFVYLDPPYVPMSKTRSFTGYTAGGFGEAEQRLLAVDARSLKERGVHVMVTNSDAPLVRELYPEPFWKVERVEARGDALNSDATKRGKVAELIIT